MSDLLPVINVAISLGYVVAACFANAFLLSRLDRSTRAFVRRGSIGGGVAALRHPSGMSQQSMLSNGDAEGATILTTSTSHQSGSSVAVPATECAARMSGAAHTINQTPVKGNQGRSSAARIPGSAPKSPASKLLGSHHHPYHASYRSYASPASADDPAMAAADHLDNGDLECCSAFGSDVPAGFREIQSWFLVHVVVSCLTQAMTILVMGVLEENLASTSSESDRLRQDLFTIPSAIVFFSLFSMLLHILHFLKDVRLSERRDPRVYWVRGGGSFMWIVAIYAAMAVLESQYEEKHFIEWGSSVNAMLLAAAFLLSGPYLYASVAQYGESTQLVARKLRNVCFLVAFSMVVRFALFLPAMQSVLGASIGKYTSSILEVWMLVPYAASIQLLHHNSRT